jgi:hypothetical protein
MKVRRRKRRLAGYTALALILSSAAAVAAGGDVVQVAADGTYGLALRSDGSVWAWGFNERGELGDGTNTQRFTPVQVRSLTGVITQVAAGGRFSLALRSDSTVWAWGRNDHGQLGRGTVSDHEATPARVAVLNHVTKISAGGDFGLALRSDGIVFAWGANQVGQLGNGTTAENHVPVKIVGLSQVTGISGRTRRWRPRQTVSPQPPRCGRGATTTTGSSATAR